MMYPYAAICSLTGCFVGSYVLVKDWGDICMADKVLTTQEAAEHLRVSKATILRWCKAGKLPAFRIGREWRINMAELDKIMLGQKPIDPQITHK